ncbi:MAG: hypothetical protein ACTHQ3_13960 [Motilibacteraceae bacterium]
MSEPPGPTPDAGPPAPRRHRRSRRVAIAVALFLAADLAAAAWFGQRLTDRPAAGPTAAPTGRVTAGTRVPSQVDPQAAARAAREQALADLLARRSRAVMHRDVTAWRATVDPREGAFAAQQDVLFSNLLRLPLAGWELAPGGEGPALSPERARVLGPDAWISRVVLRYRLRGYDAADVVRQRYLTLVTAPDGTWKIASDADAAATGAAAGSTGGGTEPDHDLWDLGPVTVEQGRRTLVVSRRDDVDLARYAREEDAAVAAVDRVWPSAWPRRVVLLVPASQQEMASVLAIPADGLGQIAAITTGQRSDGGTGTTGDRVVVNPATYDTLTALGRRVVLAHETTHVATRAVTRGAVPIWLSEGFADYVGYLDSGVPVATAARELLTQVRSGAAPTTLPVQQDFDPARGKIAAAYESAWLACRYVVAENGQDALVRLYQQVATSRSSDEQTNLAAALRSVLGLTPAQFTDGWRDYVRSQAGR